VPELPDCESGWDAITAQEIESPAARRGTSLGKVEKSLVASLADEDLDSDIIDGLRSFEPAIDILDAKKADLRGIKDPVLFDLAEQQGRIVISHDRRTMTRYFRERLAVKDGKHHTYWSLVETVRTANGPRQKTLCYLGELNSSAQARWLKTIEVFNDDGEAQQLKLFSSHIEPPDDDPQIRFGHATEANLATIGGGQHNVLGLSLPDHFQLNRKCSADSAIA
jgi:hypothetical protein